MIRFGHGNKTRVCHYIKELELKHNCGEPLTLHDTEPLNTFNWLLNEEDQLKRANLVSIGMKNIKESSTPDVRTAAALVPISNFEAPRMKPAELYGVVPASGNAAGSSWQERRQQLEAAAAIFLKKDWYKNLKKE